MNNHKSYVVFAFFIILATTLNFGFAIGNISTPEHHPLIELFLAIIVNLIALTLKFGARSQMDATQLATSFVSCVLLITAAFIWHFSSTSEILISNMPSIVCLSWGAFLANILSIIILITDSVANKRLN
jgi:Ca2+/H+ antiporter, TMEM165/GDT1 family